MREKEVRAGRKWEENCWEDVCENGMGKVRGVKNWELKGLEQERKSFGDGGLHDTFFIIKLLKAKYIFLIIDVKITLLYNTQNSP